MRREIYTPERHRSHWQALCRETHWLDRYCSAPDWGVSLCAAFQYDGELICYGDSGRENLAVFWERDVEGGRMILPPDGMWLLGSPILGPDPAKFFKELLREWTSQPLQAGLRQILVSGLYPEHPLLKTQFWKKLGGWEIEPSQRMVASLEGGLDGFLSRRSKNFRSRLRRTVKKAKAAGIEVEFMPETMDRSTALAQLNRIFAIEDQSWKGIAGRGITSAGMREFYQEMIPRLAADGNFRGLYLTQDGQDLAYLFGGIFHDYFRGLQFSFHDERQIGLGNVCQYYAIGKLSEQGFRAYDLGQGMEYKKRWSEDHIQSRSFVFQLP